MPITISDLTAALRTATPDQLAAVRAALWPRDPAPIRNLERAPTFAVDPGYEPERLEDIGPYPVGRDSEKSER